MSSKENRLEIYKKRHTLAEEDDADQRKQEAEDLAFQIPENQWSDEAKKARGGDQARSARPMLSVDMVSQPQQLILNQMLNAHLGVLTSPLSPEADDAVARIIQGLYRRIERESQAHVGRGWAYDRATKAGRGVYRVVSEWDKSSNHPFDQKLAIRPCLLQEMYSWDPAYEMLDTSDARWAFAKRWMAFDAFNEKWPKEALSTDSETFRGLNTQEPTWVRGEDGEKGAILVCEHFEKVTTETVLYLLRDGRVVEESKMPSNHRDKIVRDRVRDDTKVKVIKMTGFSILAEEEWGGQYIPLIPVFGRALQPYDGKKRWFGVYHTAKGSQQAFNYALTGAIEVAALEPKAPFHAFKGQLDGYEREWELANVENRAVLMSNPVYSPGGQMLPPPQRMQIDSNRLNVSLQLAQMAREALQSTTMTYDPSLGKLSGRQESGVAIARVQGQGEASGSHYLKNFADISMDYEARVILDAMPYYYDTPGRLARILDEEDGSETVMLNQPFYTDPETKKPVAVDAVLGEDGRPVEPYQAKTPLPVFGQGENARPPKIKYFDLSRGIYSVAVDVGRSKQTLAQEGAEAMKTILEAAPQLLPLIGPEWLRFETFPGAKQMAKILTKQRDQQFPGLVTEDEGPNAEQAQAEVGQLKQQLQQMQQQLQQAAEMIKGEQVKAQATIQAEQLKSQTTLQKADLEAQSRERIAEMEQRTKLALDEINARMKQLESALTREHEKEVTQFDAAHETALAASQEAAKVLTSAMRPSPSMERPLTEEEPV